MTDGRTSLTIARTAGMVGEIKLLSGQRNDLVPPGELSDNCTAELPPLHR